MIRSAVSGSSSLWNCRPTVSVHHLLRRSYLRPVSSSAIHYQKSLTRGSFCNVHQAQRGFHFRMITSNVSRRFSSGSEQLQYTQLACRTLVRVSGKDSKEFLQGLITNDMSLLDLNDESEGNKVMYSMMLNIQGRVLFDLILYTMQFEGELLYLVECANEVADELMKTMKRYKIRKKVDISHVGDEYKVWSAFPVSEHSVNASTVTLFPGDCSDVVMQTADPRLPSLAHRLILRDNVNGPSKLKEIGSVCDEREYHRRRYMLGVAEGPVDLPSGNCTPLESNAVFMNGVSFSKGCYIGQELTARTHHTGVIRKRLMPVVFIGEFDKAKQGDKIENSSGKNCGKLRGSLDSNGLALLRIENVVGTGNLVIKNPEGDNVGEVKTSIPGWWPHDSDEIVKKILANQNK